MEKQRSEPVETELVLDMVSTKEGFEQFLPFVLARLAQSWIGAQNADLSSSGISYTAFMVLLVLHVHKTLTVNQIADLVLVEQSNGSRIIDAMVNGGLLERRISSTDLRRREIALTTMGEQRLGAALPLVAANYGRLTEGISAADVAKCLGVLTRMLGNAR